ncbi:MAG: tRNA pseudouridine(55) synthase TruB [Nitrospiraceae bacterium]|nr:tRNA pseudouridine(55) synthase TruB [Nitrospiraceae bacterium]
MTDNNLVININKPKGITSQQTVTKVKKILSVKKAGHAGTLDPLATGVLLVCVNEATKISKLLTDANKEYTAVMKLGERTDTFDAEGKIIKKVDNFSIGEKMIIEVLRKFTGTIEQVPPMYSAVKMNGEPIYKLARKGIEIERIPRQVTIYSLDIIKYEPPFLKIKVLCSKGTYIRTLCDDIGNILGVGAHIVELTRTRSGDFNIENTVELNQLSDHSKGFYSIDAALKNLTSITLNAPNFQRAKHGRTVMNNLSDITENSYIKINDPDGRIFAIGRIKGKKICIDRMLNRIPYNTDKTKS